jgi:hypothetical protein
MLLKAVWRGFLNGCPNNSEKLVLKYLNPSPATAKGHMKRPQHGIQSTMAKIATTPVQVIAKAPVQVIDAAPIQFFCPPLSLATNNAGDDRNVQPAAVQLTGPNMIFNKDTDKSIAKIFAFGAFANKNSGIAYNTLGDRSHLCRWTEACAFLSSIITNPTVS